MEKVKIFSLICRRDPRRSHMVDLRVTGGCVGEHAEYCLAREVKGLHEDGDAAVGGERY
jgi:hypothetical protein